MNIVKKMLEEAGIITSADNVSLLEEIKLKAGSDNEWADGLFNAVLFAKLFKVLGPIDPLFIKDKERNFNAHLSLDQKIDLIAGLIEDGLKAPRFVMNSKILNISMVLVAVPFLLCAFL